MANVQVELQIGACNTGVKSLVLCKIHGNIHQFHVDGHLKVDLPAWHARHPPPQVGAMLGAPENACLPFSSFQLGHEDPQLALQNIIT